MSSDSEYEYEFEFEDSELNGQLLIEALEQTESNFAIIDAARHQPSNVHHKDLRTDDIGARTLWLDRESQFNDPIIANTLRDAERLALSAKTPSDASLNEPEEVISLTRAQLELIKQNAFLAGQGTFSTSLSAFPFLNLPAELRLVVYSHYFHDRNPLTAGHWSSALPNRLSDKDHCCSKDNIWCKTVRPKISTNLLATCKQVYHETRDHCLYKGRWFKASIRRFDSSFDAMRPNLSFWQHIQHVDLVIAPDRGVNVYASRRLILALIPILRGGQNLKSFKLKHEAGGNEGNIEKFQELKINGPVSLTQVFRDWYEPDKMKEAERKARLENLLFAIRDCSCELNTALQFSLTFTCHYLTSPHSFQCSSI